MTMFCMQLLDLQVFQFFIESDRSPRGAESALLRERVPQRHGQAALAGHGAIQHSSSWKLVMIQ